MQDLNSLQSSDSSDEGAQAWAIPFADMMTLLLTLFILLLVILKESEKFVDRQINLLLQETYEQLEDQIKNENVSIERVTKGIQITLRGNLFQSMKANVNKNIQMMQLYLHNLIIAIIGSFLQLDLLE